jgi:excisionase family DNA binding protein
MNQVPTVTGAEKLLVTCREAALLLSISERTLWSLTRRGEIPSRRIGRAVRYAVADLRAYCEGANGKRVE